MLTYSLPDFTNNLGLNLFFAQVIRERPDLAYPDVTVGNIYGCFPGCLANGGRTQGGQQWKREQMQWLFELLEEQGLACRLTLSNLLLEEKHLEDDYLQQILQIARGHKVEIIVASDVLANYLRAEYPEFKLILSTTREILDVQEFNEATERFDWVVLNYSLHRDEEFLSAIKHPDRVEVMANEFCVPNCPKRMEHYRSNSADQLNDCVRPYPCVQQKSDELIARVLGHAPGHPVMLTEQDVEDMHARYGISSFKIVGRGMPAEIVADALLYYLIRPEARAEVAQLYAAAYE